MSPENSIKCIINDFLEKDPHFIDWGLVLEKAHENIQEFLRSQITDLEDFDWLYDISEIVAYNEAVRIMDGIRCSIWFAENAEEAKRTYYERKLIKEDPDVFYGVPYSRL